MSIDKRFFNSNLDGFIIRSLDKTRLVKRIGKLETTLMEEIEAAIRIHLELGW